MIAWGKYQRWKKEHENQQENIADKQENIVVKQEI
jgi:hypothetical protein